jgi:hypothetical protein
MGQVVAAQPVIGAAGFGDYTYYIQKNVGTGATEVYNNQGVLVHTNAAADNSINWAIANCAGLEGRIFIKAGTYTINADISDNGMSHVELGGEGIGRTILISAAARAYPGRIIALIGANQSEIVDWYVHDMTLDGNAANQATGHIGYWLEYADHIVTERVRIQNINILGGTDRGKCIDCYNCEVLTFSSCETIMAIVSASGKNNLAFTGCLKVMIDGHYAYGGSSGVNFYDGTSDSICIGGKFEQQFLAVLVSYTNGINNQFIGNTIIGDGVNTQGGYFTNPAYAASPSKGNIFALNVVKECAVGFSIGANSCANIVSENEFYIAATGGARGITCEGYSNIIIGNHIYYATSTAIFLWGSETYPANDNLIANNHLHRPYYGLRVGAYANYNTFIGNVITAGENVAFGVLVAGGIGNEFTENKIRADATYMQIDAGATDTIFVDNDCRGITNAKLIDNGVNTIFNNEEIPFIDGTDPKDSGFYINASAEMARVFFHVPERASLVKRIKVFGRSVVTEAHGMMLTLSHNGAADNEGYTTHNSSAAVVSTSVNFTADDIIYWIMNAAGVTALTGKDSVELKALYNALSGDNCASDVYIRSIVVEWV